MPNPAYFNSAEAIKNVHDKETEIYELEKKLNNLINEVQVLKKKNAESISIPLKQSVLDCLEIEKDRQDFPQYFLKTPTFISNCVAWCYAVDVNTDIKNKIASTLSFMFKEGIVGRIKHNNKTYYGLAKFFEKDLVTVKKKYQNNVAQLAA